MDAQPLRRRGFSISRGGADDVADERGCLRGLLPGLHFLSLFRMRLRAHTNIWRYKLPKDNHLSTIIGTASQLCGSSLADASL